MGYLVDVTGTVRLPQRDEQRAFGLLRERMLAAEHGWLREEEEVETLEELATYAAAACSRSGELLVFAPDEEGDPKWSDQASAFWLGLGELTTAGEVRVEGEDGEVWTYTYSPEGVVQSGANGWDGTEGDVPAPGQGRPWSSPDRTPEPAPDPSAAESRRRRSRRYLVFGAIPAAGGLALLAAGEGGLLALGVGAVNLLIGWRLSRPAR